MAPVLENSVQDLTSNRNSSPLSLVRSKSKRDDVPCSLTVYSRRTTRHSSQPGMSLFSIKYCATSLL